MPVTKKPKTQAPPKSPILSLAALGQSVWLDALDKRMLDSGELEVLIEVDRLKGLTTNPSIFEQAIARSSDYSGFLAERRLECGTDPEAVYEELAIGDIRRAADAFAGV